MENEKLGTSKTVISRFARCDAALRRGKLVFTKHA
jgi:hypothetical protein